MNDFLLELLSEEIPARMQEKAAADLVRLFEAELAKSGLKAARIEGFVTPRRLALIAHGLPAATQAVSEEIKGPRADAPAQALAGFLGKTGLTREQLIERLDAKGNTVLFAVIERAGRPTPELLAEAVPNVIKAFPWPKAMRWGASSLSPESPRWVRPLQGIVALFGGIVVPVEVAGVVSGATTVGHRFHHPGTITIGSAADYAEKLLAGHVVVDSAARRRIVLEGAKAATQAAGLTMVPDEALVAENAGLTEWPVPLLGYFDPAFLVVPREVIQLTMRTNQKYFACTDGEGKFAPAFVCTANIEASDGGAAIVAGNGKVLAARLADARFFWEQDLKLTLEERTKRLPDIVFHEKLGTVADKVARVAELARWMVEEGIVGSPNPALSAVAPTDAEILGYGTAYTQNSASMDPGVFGDGGTRYQPLAALAEQAARLAKADLVTGMVGEFPELQGVMGGYYARAEGLPDAVADAIRDHYKPVGQGDDVPTAPVTVAVSLADKLDSLAQFFLIGEAPTGSKDPFALRRSALGVIALILNNGLRFRLERVLLQACGNDLTRFEKVFSNQIEKRLADFFADRLKVQQREAGIRHDLIDAVFALGGEDDLVRLLARVEALQVFVETPEGANLLAGYRRAANILRAEVKKGGGAPADFAGFSYEPDVAEQALADSLDQQLPVAERAVAGERFAESMTALSVLRPTIDRFFDEVTVNADQPEKRAARLALLAKLVAAMHKVADFSKIEG